jgi:hypothetical protein
MFAQDCSEEELRAICDGLFIPQRHHGIDAHGAARRQVSSNQTDRDHYCSGNDNRKRAGDWQVGDQAAADRQVCSYGFMPSVTECNIHSLPSVSKRKAKTLKFWKRTTAADRISRNR